MKTALVLGAGGFIGSHLVKRLKSEGYWVRGVDLKQPEYWDTVADEFLIYDLRNPIHVEAIMRLEGVDEQPLPFHYYPRPFCDTIEWDEVYQLAADMGGAGYIFTGENDANIMHNSALINLNVTHEAAKQKVKRIFYSSSACMYPAYNQCSSFHPNCEESSAYPAAPDSEYGWEKLFSERLYLAFNKNYGLDVRIARFHNIFGPYGTWASGKEKAPAAICRKVVCTESNGEIEVWGDGQQTRSFLYIDECIEAMLRFMRQDEFMGPVNIGSEEMVTINELASMVIEISDKIIDIRNIEGPQGVRGRNSDNKLYKEKMGWEPTQSLYEGLEETYEWVYLQCKLIECSK